MLTTQRATVMTIGTPAFGVAQMCYPIVIFILMLRPSLAAAFRCEVADGLPDDGWSPPGMDKAD